jgi:hypothetical protein
MFPYIWRHPSLEISNLADPIWTTTVTKIAIPISDLKFTGAGCNSSDYDSDLGVKGQAEL